MPPNDITGEKWLEKSNNAYHYRRIAVAMAANGRGWPWKLLRLDDCGIFRSNCRGLPWRLPRCRGNGRGWPRGNCRGSSVRWSLSRKKPQNVPWPQLWHLPWKCHGPWHLPWKPTDFHGSPWQYPRKSTEVERSLPRTSAKKSSNMHPCIVVSQKGHQSCGVRAVQ